MVSLAALGGEDTYACHYVRSQRSVSADGLHPPDDVYGALRRSVESLGIVVPLLVVRTASGRTCLLDGWRRRAVARACGIRTVPCVSVEPAAPRTLFMTALSANSGGVWSDMDRALVVTKAQQVLGMSDDEVARTIAPLIGLPPSRSVVREYRALTGMSTFFKDMLARGELNVRPAFALMTWSQAEQTVMAKHIVGPCFFSAAELRHCVELMRTLMKREGRSLSALVRRRCVRMITTAPDLTRRERGMKLLALLQEMNYPITTQMKQRTAAVLARLPRSRHVTVAMPATFEEERRTVTLSLASANDIDAAVRYLTEHKNTIAGLFDVERNLHLT